jgi:sensor histidine kinase YesM
MGENKFTSAKGFTIALHVLAWLIVFSVPLILRAASEEGLDLQYILRPTYWIYHGVIVFLFYFNANLLVPAVLYKRGTGRYLLAALGVTVIASLIIMISFSFFTRHQADWKAHEHHPEWIFIGSLFPSILSCAVSASYRIIRDRNRTEQQMKERENEHLKSELTFLRSQVSPHFMFNVLNNIVSLSRKRSEMVEPVVIKLSQLMRYMLYESGEDKVALDKELEYLQSYVDLQMLRFGNDVKLELDIRNKCEPVSIEPMLLIPFVENAFKHGIALIEHPEISIRLACTGHELGFSVKNKFNDKAKEEKDKNSGIGLNNVKRRLNLLYKDKHKLEVKQEGNWFITELNIKLK